MDGADHPGVKVIGWFLMVVFAAGLGIHLWIANEQEKKDAWDIVPIGARCETLGTEERTYGGGAVFCASFPHYGIQIWSRSDADLAAPVPTPVDAREAQVRVCMHQARLDRRNCEAGIEQYEPAR